LLSGPVSRSARHPVATSVLHRPSRSGCTGARTGLSTGPNPLARSNILFAGIDIVRAFRVLLFERHVDAVVCVFENTALIIVALRGLFLFKPPVLLYEVSARGWRWRDWVLDFVVPRVDQVLTLTRHSKQYVESCYKLKRPAIVTGYSIDHTFFRPDAPLTTSQEVPADFILAVGDDHSRDYDTLLRACMEIRVHIVLRTRLNPEIPPEMLDRTDVIHDRLSYRELRDLYLQARLVVISLHPTENPGGITSIFEAMAMARPVICSATGVGDEYVRHGETGLLIPPNDPPALRAAICRLLDDPDEADRLGAAARRYVERELTNDRFTARMAAAIGECTTLMRGCPDSPMQGVDARSMSSSGQDSTSSVERSLP
jgi:glycosyltransferase involved in cell wall biosynthesis